MNILRYIIFGLMLLTSQLFFAQDYQAIVQEINKLPVNSDKATYERLLMAFAKTGTDIKEIEPGILNATNNGHYEMIPVVEKTVLPSQKNVQSLVDYYINSGVSIGAFCNKPSKAIEYISKGIDLAQKNNLNKKLFSSINGQLNHAWGYIAINYEQINDPKNAAYAYIKAGKEIKKYYPFKTNTLNEFMSLSSYMMYKYLSSMYEGNEVFVEYFPYLMEYSETGNLKSLSVLWNYFIDVHDIDGLNFIDFQIIPKEKDQRAIAEYYWETAEQFQHDELYQDAILYHFKLIEHSHLNNFKEYLFIEIKGIRHSRFEYIAYCFDKLGEIENYIQSIINALNEVALEYGTDSEEFKYYSDYLYMLKDDPIKGPILQNFLDNMDK